MKICAQSKPGKRLTLFRADWPSYQYHVCLAALQQPRLTCTHKCTCQPYYKAQYVHLTVSIVVCYMCDISCSWDCTYHEISNVRVSLTRKPYYKAQCVCPSVVSIVVYHMCDISCSCELPLYRQLQSAPHSWLFPSLHQSVIPQPSTPSPPVQVHNTAVFHTGIKFEGKSTIITCTCTIPIIGKHIKPS